MATAEPIAPPVPAAPSGPPSPEPAERARRRSVPVAVAIGVTLVVAIGAGLLYAFNPAEHALYPQCMMYRTTGLLCPGCGGLRATHQLLHGHLAEAFRLNPMFVLLLPLAAWFGLDWAWRAAGRRSIWPFRHVGWIIMLAIFLLGFSIARNVPAVARWLDGGAAAADTDGKPAAPR